MQTVVLGGGGKSWKRNKQNLSYLWKNWERQQKKKKRQIKRKKKTGQKFSKLFLKTAL